MTALARMAAATLACLITTHPASAQSGPILDFEFFKERVQPILLAKRPGHARCHYCLSAKAYIALPAFTVTY